MPDEPDFDPRIKYDPEQFPEEDCYETLGVSPNASQGVISAAFKELSKSYYAELANGGDKSAVEEKQKKLGEAYTAVKDPKRRKKYDVKREAQRQPPPPPPPIPQIRPAFVDFGTVSPGEWLSERLTLENEGGPVREIAFDTANDPSCFVIAPGDATNGFPIFVDVSIDTSQFSSDQVIRDSIIVALDGVSAEAPLIARIRLQPIAAPPLGSGAGAPPPPTGTYIPPSSVGTTPPVGPSAVRKTSNGWAIALGWFAGFIFLEILGPFIGRIMLELLPRTPDGFGWLGFLWIVGCSILFGILITSLIKGNGAQAGAATVLAVLLTGVTGAILAAVGSGANASTTGQNGAGNVIGSAPGSGNGSSENRQVVPALSEDASNEINIAINNWRDALISNDPARLANCYAETVDRYFLQTNVTHDYVKQYIVNMHDRGDFVRTEQISEIGLQRLSDTAVEAQFIEAFESFSAGQERQGTVRTILHFVQEAGVWKISYERQLDLPPESTATENATVQNTPSPSDNPAGPVMKTTDNSAIAPPPATQPEQAPSGSGTSDAQSIESQPAAVAVSPSDPPASRVPYTTPPPIPPQVSISTDADRRGTLTLFPDRIEYRDEGMGTNGGPAPYGPNPDNNFTLSCAEILGIKAYGFRPVLFGSYQVVITARSGKYHIPTLHSQPIVQGIQNRCGVGTGDSTQKR
jgi:ketosteroid isomerase-like protein